MMSRFPSLPRLALFVFIGLGMLGGPAIGQQGAPLLPAAGGVGHRLDDGTGHTIVAYPSDAGFSILCLRGDRHDAVAALRWIRAQALVAGQTPGDAVVDPSVPTKAVTVTAAMRFVPRARAGADLADRPLLYTPRELQPGSSVSHFDTSATPNLLMEPNINPDLGFEQLDLTDNALLDLGWRSGNNLQVELEFADVGSSGFNDDELGTLRRTALDAAVGTWERALASDAPLVVDASFDDLDCDINGGAVLASAGPTTAFRDFPGSQADTWYPGPVAESITGQDLNDGADPDIEMVFNSAIDDGCLGPGTGWFYGSAGETPAGTFPFVVTALHELAHGLGFISLVDPESGEFFRDQPDIFSRMIFDNRRDRSWDELGQPGRRVSATRDGKVVFTGRRSRRGVRRLLDGSVILKILQPGPIAGLHRVGVAQFGPEIEEIEPVVGELVLAKQGAPTPRLGCDTIQNPGEVAGNIAVVDRGECTFVTKVRNAQDAGAIAVVVINNVPGAPVNMAGDDPTIAIPAVMVDIVLGRKIRRRIR